jgi:glutamate N-acetyltransferase/amino-acid N-acetyltransferase
MKYKIPQDFWFATSSLDLKTNKAEDLLLILTKRPAVAAGVFTKNTFCGAPVTVSKTHLKKAKNIQAILINAGVANAATGKQGIQDAKKCAKLTAQQIGCKSENVLVASTGVIGKFLPMKKIEAQIPKFIEKLNQNITKAARSIMTTDTVPKIAQAKIGSATILGIAKGSGMIAPNMATTLIFVMTDAKIPYNRLQKIWAEIINDTVNMVSIDACESTSDMAIVLANSVKKVNEKNFAKALFEVAKSLAIQIASDGEGATTLVEVKIKKANTKKTARILAKAVIESDLVKTAIHGKDPNWGRIISAIGSTKIRFKTKKLKLKIDGELIFSESKPVAKFNSSKLFRGKKTEIEINLNSGKHEATAWGCDLSKDYITINADYHT